MSASQSGGTTLVVQRLVSTTMAGHDSGADSSTASVSVWVKYRLYILAVLFVSGSWSDTQHGTSTVPHLRHSPSVTFRPLISACFSLFSSLWSVLSSFARDAEESECASS